MYYASNRTFAAIDGFTPIQAPPAPPRPWYAKLPFGVVAAAAIGVPAIITAGLALTHHPKLAIASGVVTAGVGLAFGTVHLAMGQE